MDLVKTELISGFSVVVEPVHDCLKYLSCVLPCRKKRCFFACLNPHSYVVAHKDRVFRKALQNADLLVPDGAGIVAASRLLGGNIRSRITGSDIFNGVNQLLDRNQGSVFFLGSTEKNLAAIRLKMANLYPNIRIVGTYSPPFKEVFSEEDNSKMVAAINKSAPDVLWIGMTAPKQEKWAYQNMAQLEVGFIGAVGAVFDFFVGNVKRSHPIFQRLGLEWLPRLLRQPDRLWKRNFISSPLFVLSILCSYFRKWKT